MHSYKVVKKVIDNPYPYHMTLTTAGDFQYVKNHFGLDSYDVEWYTIEKGKDEQ